MSLTLEENPMVWVVVQTVDKVEQYVGQHHADLEIMFIPFFEDKEEAQQGMSLIRREKGRRFQVQAVRFRELAEDAAQHGFLLFQTDADGNVLEKVDPHTVI